MFNVKPAESGIKDENEEDFIQLFTEGNHRNERDGSDPFSLQHSEFPHSSEMSQCILVKDELSIQNRQRNKQAIDLDNHHSIGRSIGKGTARNVSDENAVSKVRELIKPGKSAVVASKLDMVVDSSGQGTSRTADGEEIMPCRIPKMSHSERKHRCTVCGAKFLRKRSLETHMTIHTGEKPFSCSFCDKKFRLKELLKPHEMWHKDELLQCSLCGGRYLHLAAHMKNVHSTISHEHFCSVCKKGFRRAHYLRKHMLTHTDERPCSCHDCGRRFRTQKYLMLHMVTHTKEKKHACNVCGKKFSRRGGLNTHMRVHSGEKPYRCETCDRAFTQSSALDLHRLTHTSEKAFMCSACGKAFRQLHQLRRHALIHSGEQPYECPECGMRFNQSGSVLRHMLTHSGEKPYSCSDCGQRFTQSGGLCSHRRKHCSAKKTQM